MKKVLLVSLIGPVWVIISRIFDVIKSLNATGVYECAISIHKPCSLFDYIFKSDEATIAYASMILSFITLLLITSFIFFLIKLYKASKRILFWILIVMTVVLVCVSYFVGDYL